MAPARRVNFFVPTWKPYSPVIPGPTRMADKEFTFAAGMGRRCTWLVRQALSLTFAG